MKKVMKKEELAILISMITILFVGCILIQTNQTDASTPVHEKLYKSIQIQPGDTLWSISESYMSDEYSSVNDYIKEVKEINGFNGNTIYEGGYLIVPYYTE
jgi:cell division protein YceG involved in septum cleavage